MPAFRPLLPLALASAGLAGGVLGARPAATGSRPAPPGPPAAPRSSAPTIPPGRRLASASRSRSAISSGPSAPTAATLARSCAGRTAPRGFERDPGVVARRAEAGLRRQARRRRLRSLRRRCRRRRAAPRHQPGRRRALAVVAAGRAPRLREPRATASGICHAVDPAAPVAGRRAADRHHHRRDRAARLARRPPRGVRVDRRRRGRRGRSLAAPAERPRRRDGGRRDAARPDAADPGARGRVVAGVGAGRRTAGLRA